MGGNNTLGEIREKVRDLIGLQQNQTLLLFCRGVLPMANEKMSNLAKFVEADGFIYLYFCEQDAFGLV